MVSSPVPCVGCHPGPLFHTKQNQGQSRSKCLLADCCPLCAADAYLDLRLWVRGREGLRCFPKFCLEGGVGCACRWGWVATTVLRSQRTLRKRFSQKIGAWLFYPPLPKGTRLLPDIRPVSRVLLLPGWLGICVTPHLNDGCPCLPWLSCLWFSSGPYP